jgi:hypothetical protein
LCAAFYELREALKEGVAADSRVQQLQQRFKQMQVRLAWKRWALVVVTTNNTQTLGAGMRGVLVFHPPPFTD